MPTAPRTAATMLAALAAACAAPPAPTAPEPWVAPDNAWSSTPPPDGLVGAGFDVGEVVPDVRLLDQHGDEVSLWQFYGRVVLLTISAVWCEPCRDLAADAEDVVADYDDVVLVTILEEDAGGLRPEVADAAAWAEAFGGASPVLADPEAEAAEALTGGYPGILAIGRDLVVGGRLAGGTADDLRALVEAER